MLDTYYANSNDWLDYRHSRTIPPENVQFHLHNDYEIYFFIAGDVNYFIEKQVYPLKYGDLLLINNHEIHKPTFGSLNPYERIVIHFEAQLGKVFSTPDFNLLQSFLNRLPGQKNKINLSSTRIPELMRLFVKLERLADNPPAGADTLKLCYFIEILTFIRQLSLNMTPVGEELQAPEALMPILEYIDNHLAEDLTLESLSRRFYLNQSYLSRLFKKSIGSNIHEFIIYKRISKAKKLLSEGFNVTETCSTCGFNDYANFLRMFKRKVGVSPGKYQKNIPKL